MPQVIAIETDHSRRWLNGFQPVMYQRIMVNGQEVPYYYDDVSADMAVDPEAGCRFSVYFQDTQPNDNSSELNDLHEQTLALLRRLDGDLARNLRTFGIVVNPRSGNINPWPQDGTIDHYDFTTVERTLRYSQRHYISHRMRFQGSGQAVPIFLEAINFLNMQLALIYPAGRTDFAI